MFVYTYDLLKNSIIRYTQRNDDTFVSAIPTFVMLAQKRIAKELKTLNTKAIVTGTLTDLTGIVQKPADWISTISFSIKDTNNNLNPLIFANLTALNLLFKDETNGLPTHICDFDFNNWKLFGLPDALYDFEVQYYYQPPILSEDIQENIFTKTYQDLLLYACLLETAPFLKNDERVQIWDTYYKQAKESYLLEDASRMNAYAADNTH